MNWAKNSVVYQIYPRSFKDSNNDGIGDLKGIIEKLDYLNNGKEDSLGINVIWLSPIYKSPMIDFGYDISDYKDIDPIFGDLLTFDLLIQEAIKRDIKVLMDFVPNHTSSKHPWFIESAQSKNSKKRNWYIWADPAADGSPPNNWLSVFGGSAWEYDPSSKQYYLHTFLKEQPDLNWRNNDVRQAMKEVLEFWLHRGVSGFRTDAIYHLIKDSEFRDDPPNPNFEAGKDDPYDSLLHIYSRGLVEVHDVTNSLCEVLGMHKDTFMVSEAYLNIPQMQEMYKACTNKLHAPFNFNLISMPWDAVVYKKFIDEFHASLKSDDIPNYVLGNHDRSRVATRLGEKRARLSAMLILTLAGMPFIYYGDELGMTDGITKTNGALDPFEKNVPGFKLGRDGERTPMQWDNTKYAGFSNVKPWLTLAENYETVNVGLEMSDSKSMLFLYRFLIKLRKKSKAIIQGSYKSLDLKNKNIFSYLRVFNDEKVLVVLNFSEKEENVFFDYEFGKLIRSTYMDKEINEKTSLKPLLLRPYEGCIYCFA